VPLRAAGGRLEVKICFSPFLCQEEPRPNSVGPDDHVGALGDFSEDALRDASGGVFLMLLLMRCCNVANLPMAGDGLVRGEIALVSFRTSPSSCGGKPDTADTAALGRKLLLS